MFYIWVWLWKDKRSGVVGSSCVCAVGRKAWLLDYCVFVIIIVVDSKCSGGVDVVFGD